MASEGSTQALIKRRNDELALMPPPPTKRIKRPTEVLDEDKYTEALSDIIARDYFPGLREAKAQEEYLSALDSKNSEWIKEAGRKLQAATNGEVEIKKPRRETRDARFDTPRSYKLAAETPRGDTGADTPVTVATDIDDEDDRNEYAGGGPAKQDLDTATLSLSAYQAKYTSEDNASFNDLLDTQNSKRRQKHAHLWTPDQKILSTRQIEYRTSQQRLLENKAEYEASNKQALIPITTGAVAERSAKPESWKTSRPDNTFMFAPTTSVDEMGLQTIMEVKEAMSKAGPKEIVHANTRFPPTGPSYSADGNEDVDHDDTTSIHTSFIARRNNQPSNPRNAADDSASTLTGAETPRVNGYAFVDEDAPPPTLTSYAPHPLISPSSADATPNPFKLSASQKREALHHRLVERDAEKKRAKQKDTTKPAGRAEAGNMTPAAQRLLGRLGGGGGGGGQTPIRGSDPSSSRSAGKVREDWTPVATPRRSRVVTK